MKNTIFKIWVFLAYVNVCLAGCPINQDPTSGGIPASQWGNVQWPNEIWVETGYTT